jgi:hypothetical protein
MAQKVTENEKNDGANFDDTDDSLLEGHVHTYFHRTSPMFKGMEKSAKHDNFVLPPAAESDEEREHNLSGGRMDTSERTEEHFSSSNEKSAPQ